MVWLQITLLNLALAQVPPGFVDVKTVNSDLRVELAYVTDWNFVGRPLDGYHANVCWLTEKAAKALSEVQKDLAKERLGLLIYDCYRPQRAVNQLVAWTKDPSDKVMKSIFYPTEPKDKLIEKGYIASTSGHSRGSTVDLTLVRKGKYPSKNIALGIKAVRDCRKFKNAESLGLVDMGTAYDCFSENSNTSSTKVSSKALRNRLILKTVMEKHGFAHYDQEWWHFTLRDEPFKDQYFDFEINR